MATAWRAIDGKRQLHATLSEADLFQGRDGRSVASVRPYFSARFAQTTETNFSACHEQKLLPSPWPYRCKICNTTHTTSTAGREAKLHYSRRYKVVLQVHTPFKLLADIKKYYNDPKVQAMLTNIVTNPIETPRGYKNPGHGVALRGPLSQFFSALYLKPLDDAFNNMEVTYLRYQDDFLILCKTKRQLNRCRRRLMEVLHERHLSLSRKKSRMGCINGGFHFLGIDYLPTRMEDNTNVTHANDVFTPSNNVHYLGEYGGG